MSDARAPLLGVWRGLALLFCAWLFLDGCNGSPRDPRDAAQGSRGSPTAPSRCATLGLRELGSDAGAGHRHLRLGLTNLGLTACVLGGYPDVALLDSAGRRIEPLRIEHDEGTYLMGVTPADSIVLAPGTAAFFDVGWVVVEGEPGGCLEGSALRVAMPGASDGAVGTVPAPVRACGARISVTPLVEEARVR